ncbi:MAG: transglutaminase domain-containing protein [Thainema sp.]
MLTNSDPSLTSSPQSTVEDDITCRTIRPIGAYALHGIAWVGDKLIAVDSVHGYLFEIDRATDNTKILNEHTAHEWVGATGLSVWENEVWFTSDRTIYRCTFPDLKPEPFVTMPYPLEGVAVWDATVYVACQRIGYIIIFNRENGQRITQIPAPGIGEENLAISNEDLWVCDRTEQTVYCLDRATGDIRFTIMTPYDNPTGIAIPAGFTGNQGTFYIAHAGEEPYIRDNPNLRGQTLELAFRDRTFIYPLHFNYDPAKNHTLSNGYLIEMTYVEELSALDEVKLDNLEWRIAMPMNSDRQRVRWVEPVGMPYTEETVDGQRVALFKFDQLHTPRAGLFGWRALLEVRGIRYQLLPSDVERHPPLSSEYQANYLVDDDELSMDEAIIRDAARDAIGSETNLLRQVLSIRDYVYDKLSYGIKPHIDTPDVVLRRGTGSCGEYVGLLLALMRLNGIACRTVGRYKCPPPPDRRGVPLQPDFNHVWIEFFIPGYGWVPMESNVDDIQEGGPYPTRFFMALPWYHIEMSRDVPFEKIRVPGIEELGIKIGELAINHVRFTILDELPPPTD